MGNSLSAARRQRNFSGKVVFTSRKFTNGSFEFPVYHRSSRHLRRTQHYFVRNANFFFLKSPKEKEKGKDSETGCSQCKVTKHELQDDDDNKVLELSRTNLLLVFLLVLGFEDL